MIDIMEAVKYNKARVIKVFNALLGKDRKPIFRDPITKLFTMRLEAKEDKNDALSEGTKLLMNSSYGKLGQGIHDNKIVISDDNSEIDKLYQNGQVSTDIMLANEEQCMLDINKKRLTQAKYPVHLNCFYSCL